MVTGVMPLQLNASNTCARQMLQCRVPLACHNLLHMLLRALEPFTTAPLFLHRLPQVSHMPHT